MLGGMCVWRSASTCMATAVGTTSSPTTQRPGSLLVVEIKTRLGDVQDTLGRLDVKVRLARNVGRQFGWQPATVTPLLLVAEDATNRRRVAAHPTLFSSFSLRGRAALAWLRRPTQGGTPSGLLAFRKLSSASQRGVITARRVRRHQPPAT